ncbi:MAG TPA: aminotransferase class IV [Caulobacteraceae bacterium]|nr:aminotransferase class IV [Caulobacteraceae bacterium]
MPGSQDYARDPRNEHLLVYVNGALVPRAEARVSIFDAGFTMGDGVWEGLRLHRGRLLFLEEHLDRLIAGAAAIRFDPPLDRAAIETALRETVEANAMTDGAHLRLMVTRGLKTDVNQDPRNAVGVPTVVITAEYKAPPVRAPGWGLSLHTSTVRCTGPEMFDMRLNSHSRLNLIRALLEAIDAGADEALMLDPHGKVSSCNATNFFFVKGGAVHTSTGAWCFNGVTRGHVIALCRDNAIPLHVGDFDLAEVHAAEEAFVTGTLGGLTPVAAIDGHRMASSPGPITRRLTLFYEALKDADAARGARL